MAGLFQNPNLSGGGRCSINFSISRKPAKLVSCVAWGALKSVFTSSLKKHPCSMLYSLELSDGYTQRQFSVVSIATSHILSIDSLTSALILSLACCATRSDMLSMRAPLASFWPYDLLEVQRFRLYLDCSSFIFPYEY